MALKKEITNQMGIVASYHRIQEIKYDNGVAIVTVYSYVSEDYRNIDKIPHLIEMYSEEYENNPSDEIGNKIKKLQLMLNGKSTPNFVFMNDYVFNFNDDEDISLSKLYDKIKEDDVFSGAEDV